MISVVTTLTAPDPSYLKKDFASWIAYDTSVDDKDSFYALIAFHAYMPPSSDAQPMQTIAEGFALETAA